MALNGDTTLALIRAHLIEWREALGRRLCPRTLTLKDLERAGLEWRLAHKESR